MQPQATLTVDVRGRTFALACPARPDELLERAATRGEEAPYWAELWPCARRLAGALCERELAGRRVVELGCGLGLPSLVAAARGADVLATDVERAALGCVCQSATGLGLSLQTLVADYRDPPAALLAAAPFDLVVAADV